MSNIHKFKIDDFNSLYFNSKNSKLCMNEIPENDSIEYAEEDLISLRLEITHLCNGACDYCIVHGNHVERFDKNTIEEIWSWLNEQSWFEKIIDIFILGGEPLIVYDDIIYILKHFNGSVNFSTNSTLITEKHAKELAEYRNLRIYVSLDGETKEENRHRVYCDGTEMYDDILTGLNLLEKYNVRKGLFMVANPETVVKAGKMMERLSKKYKLERIGYSLPHWTDDGEDLVTPEQYRDALIDIFNNIENINSEVMQISWRINPLMYGQAKRFSCCFHTQQTTLLPGFNIVRCSKIDSNPNFNYVTNEYLNENCPIERSKNTNCKCSNCIALSSCGGGCPFDGLKRYNDIIDYRECVITPALIEVVLNKIANGLKSNKINSGLITTDLIKNIIFGGKQL